MRGVCLLLLLYEIVNYNNRNKIMSLEEYWRNTWIKFISSAKKIKASLRESRIAAPTQTIVYFWGYRRSFLSFLLFSPFSRPRGLMKLFLYVGRPSEINFMREDYIYFWGTTRISVSHDGLWGKWCLAPLPTGAKLRRPNKRCHIRKWSFWNYYLYWF